MDAQNEGGTMARNGALILPDARNEEAAAIAKVVDRVMTILPAGVDRQQFATALVVAGNELSQRCSPKSVLMAAFNAARLGLMPGGALGLCYFVPFKGECTLIPGFRGFIDLAYSNDFLRSLSTEVILGGEKFRHW